MRSPYAWKELRESRRLALASLGAFLAISFLPSLLEAAHAGWNWYSGNGLGMMFLGGPFLAIVVGVYAVGREQGAIERFWRSRPVSLNRWLVGKYFVGLALVWFICWTPLSIELLGKSLERPSRPVSDLFEAISMPAVYNFILLLIYSVSFVLGQCVRGILHAAILAVGVMALILVMPLVVAPLNWLSVELVQRADVGVLDARSFVAFAATMTALSIALLGLAGILWKRNVQMEVDQRTLGWSVAAILLVLTAGIAFPMGTNLPAQQVISLPMTQEGEVHGMATDGNDVLILLSHSSPWNGSKLGLVRVHVGGETPVVDEPIWFADPGQERTFYYRGLDLEWPAEDRSLAYVAVRQSVLKEGTLKDPSSVLYTVALDGKQADPVVHRVELNPLWATQDGRQTACLHQQRLYIYSDEHRKERLLTFSLADPRAPSLVHSEDLMHRIGWLFESSPQEYRVWLAPIPGLDDPTRLEITYELAADLWVHAGDERILASDIRSGSFAPRLVLYEAGPTQDDAMPLHPIAQRRSAAFEGLLGSWHGRLFYSTPLVYRLEGSGVTVYRIGDSKLIERVGHYAAEGGFSAMVSLPGDRAVLAGKRLHILDLSDKVSSSAAR